MQNKQFSKYNYSIKDTKMDLQLLSAIRATRNACDTICRFCISVRRLGRLGSNLVCAVLGVTEVLAFHKFSGMEVGHLLHRAH